MFATIALLALTAHQDEPLPRFGRMSEAMAVVRELGYETGVPSKDGRFRTLRKAGAEVSLNGMVSPAPDDAPGSPGALSHLLLTIEVATPDQLPLMETGVDPYDPAATKVSTVPHLGKTVTITGTIPVASGATRATLRSALDRFWRQGGAFSKTVGARFAAAPERDWSTYRFEDRYVLSSIEDVSMARLLASWGWRHRPKAGSGYGRSGAGWLHFATIRDRDIVVSESFPGGPDRGRFYVGGTIELPPSVEGKAWAVAKGESMPTLTLMPYGDRRVGVQAPVDLGRGIPLAEVRRRIESIVDTIVALERRP